MNFVRIRLSHFIKCNFYAYCNSKLYKIFKEKHRSTRTFLFELLFFGELSLKVACMQIKESI